MTQQRGSAESDWQKMRREGLAQRPAIAAQLAADSARDALINAVIDARAARGWTQKNLAEAAGMKQPAIARFEAGDVDPRFATVVRICAALGMDVSIGKVSA